MERDKCQYAGWKYHNIFSLRLSKLNMETMCTSYISQP